MRGTIIAAGIKRFQKGARLMFECVFDDGTARLHCRWWQAQAWMPDWYAVGREFLIYGKLDNEKKPRTFTHPETEYCEPGDDEFIHVNRIVPIHPLTEGLTARVMRSIIWRALEKYENELQVAGCKLPVAGGGWNSDFGGLRSEGGFGSGCFSHKRGCGVRR